MEKYTLDRDINICCLTADSFPTGIQAAFDRLYARLPSLEGRRFYAVSRPNRQGTIIYKAAVEQTDEREAAALGCEPFTIPKGEYISIYIRDYHQDIPAIQRAFMQLVRQPGVDHEGYCVEMYEGPDNIRCMVKLAPPKA